MKVLLIEFALSIDSYGSFEVKGLVWKIDCTSNRDVTLENGTLKLFFHAPCSVCR